MAEDYIPEMGPTGASMLPKQTTAPGAGPDPFEPSEVPPTKLATPEPGEKDKGPVRISNPRYDSFIVTLAEGQVQPLLPEDPNRAFFKVCGSFTPAMSGGLFQAISIGKRSQLANGTGYVIGGPGSEETFTTTDFVAVILRSGSAGNVQTVSVWVEYVD